MGVRPHLYYRIGRWGIRGTVKEKGYNNDFLFGWLNSHTHNLWLTLSLEVMISLEWIMYCVCVRYHLVKLSLMVTLSGRRCAPTFPVGSWGTASLFSWTGEVSWYPQHPLPSRATRWTFRGRRGPRSHGRKCLLEKDNGRRRQTWRKVSYRSCHSLNPILLTFHTEGSL